MNNNQKPKPTPEQIFEQKAVTICLNTDPEKIKEIIPVKLVNKMVKVNDCIINLLNKKNQILNTLDTIEIEYYKLRENFMGLGSGVATLFDEEYLSKDEFEKLHELAIKDLKKEPEKEKVLNKDTETPKAKQPDMAGSAGKSFFNENELEK